MRTDSRELLAVGILGGHSRIGERIGMLTRRRRTISLKKSAASILLSALGLIALAVPGALSPRWILFAEQDLPSFEAASIKPNNSGPGFSAIRPLVGGRFSATNIDLKTLIALAFHVRTYDVKGGPEWLTSNHYDVEAKAAGNAPGDQIALMLRGLLAERFRLSVHREDRDLPRYAIAVARGGLRLPRIDDEQCSPVDSDVRSLPKLPCGSFRLTPGAGGTRHIDAGSITMPELSAALEQILREPVVDETGILESFNVHLEWTPDSSTPGIAAPPAATAQSNAPLTDDSGISIFTALREQLGLQLRAEKGPVPVIVIDHVEKPDAN